MIRTDAVYPAAAGEGMTAQAFLESDAHGKWWEDYYKKLENAEPYRGGMNEYCRTMMEELLSGKEENAVCSPLNTFIAFAMLAEVTGGNTQKQILDMLKVSDIEELRAQVTALWESNYIDTPMLKSLLANSLWLRNRTSYKEDTLKLLAEKYYTSSFRGDPASEEMSKALQEWTDENTGGLLSDYTKDMKLNADTILAIVSTIYYKAAWTDEFYADANTEEVFHGTKGDTTVEMMHKTDTMNVFRNDRFTSISLGLTDSGSMYFYLPNEGVSVDEIIADPELFDATAFDWDDRFTYPLVNLSLPKFKVNAKTDLIGTLQDLGVTDVLTSGVADFSPLTEDADAPYLSAAEHAALVEIDEHGVTGAAYTELMVAEGAMEPDEQLDLVFDRPFLFIVTGSDGSVLFSGTVKNIE